MLPPRFSLALTKSHPERSVDGSVAPDQTLDPGPVHALVAYYHSRQLYFELISGVNPVSLSVWVICQGPVFTVDH